MKSPILYVFLNSISQVCKYRMHLSSLLPRAWVNDHQHLYISYEATRVVSPRFHLIETQIAFYLRMMMVS